MQACQRQLKSAQEQIDCLEADKEALHNHLANATRKAKQLDLERAEVLILEPCHVLILEPCHVLILEPCHVLILEPCHHA